MLNYIFMNINSVQANTKKFSKREALSFAWKALTGNFWFLALTVFIAFVAGNIPSFIFLLKQPNVLQPQETFTSVVQLYSTLFFHGLWVLAFLPVLYSVLIKIYDRQQLSFKDLIPNLSRSWKLFLLSLLFFLAYFVFCTIFAVVCTPVLIMFNPLQDGVNGLQNFIIAIALMSILLFISIIYIVLRLSFTVVLIVDRSSGPLEAIKESWLLTKGNVANIFITTLIGYIPIFWNIALTIILLKGLIERKLYIELSIVTLILTSVLATFVLLSIVYAYRKLSSSSANEIVTQ